MRYKDFKDNLIPFVEKGIKYPAVEVRGICKHLLKDEKEVIEENNNKKIILNLTPRVKKK